MNLVRQMPVFLIDQTVAYARQSTAYGLFDESAKTDAEWWGQTESRETSRSLGT